MFRRVSTVLTLERERRRRRKGKKIKKLSPLRIKSMGGVSASPDLSGPAARIETKERICASEENHSRSGHR